MYSNIFICEGFGFFIVQNVFCNYFVNFSARTELINFPLKTPEMANSRLYSKIWWTNYDPFSDVVAKIPFREHSNRDLVQLVKILESEYEDRQLDSRFMVFARTRIIAKILAERLPAALKACHLTGSSVSCKKGGRYYLISLFWSKIVIMTYCAILIFWWCIQVFTRISSINIHISYRMRFGLESIVSHIYYIWLLHGSQFV